MGKLDEKKQLIIGCSAVLLCIVAVNIWLLTTSRGIEHVPVAIETDVNVLPASAAGGSPQQPEEPGTAKQLPAISPEMANQIRRLSKYDPHQFTEVTNEDGSISIQTNGQFQTVTAGAAGPDGKVVIGHGEEFLRNVKAK